MVKVLFVGAKVSAPAKVVIGKRAAGPQQHRTGPTGKQEFFGIYLQQVGIGRGRKWRVNFATVKKTVDVSARALTLRVEDSSENNNEDADGVDLSRFFCQN